MSANKFDNRARARAYYAANKKHRNRYWSAWARTPRGRWLCAKRRAKQRGIEFRVSYKTYSVLTESPCHYCSGKLPEAGVGLDRINSSKGYIKGNIIPCCAFCNQAKNDLSQNDFKLQILAIYRHWASK